MLHRHLIPRWLGLLIFLGGPWHFISAQQPAARMALELTADERAWLAAHPTIKVGADPQWPPFSASSDGQTRGIDPDLLALLGQRLGVAFEFVPAATWSEVYRSAERGELDLLVGTAHTAEREKTFDFTEPYFSFPVVIVTREDAPILWSVFDLAGRRVVGVRGYVATSEMARLYPDIHFLPETETVAEAMEMVSGGEADAFVTNLPNASFTAKTLGLTNVKIAGVMPERFNLRYAVRRDWPELTALLNRAIGSLDEADRQAVLHSWIRVDYAKVIRWDLVWKTALAALAVLGAVMGLFVYHNRRLARELEVQIQLRAEIKAAHDKLVQIIEDKTELLQMAAHDLRGPLTGIQLAIDASLRLQIVPSLEALQIIDRQVRQMTGLLSDLLDAEALEQGRREFQMVRLAPAEVVQAAIDAYEPAAAQKRIRVEAEFIDGLPEVEVDATALRQIADNLLSNAIKFSPPDSVVRVVLEPTNEFVRLELRDRGPGVDPNDLERIFEKYARGSARPTAGEKSTGLGLSIVRQLAEAINARVWCDSRLGEGSSFVLMIPAAGTPAEKSDFNVRPNDLLEAGAN